MENMRRDIIPGEVVICVRAGHGGIDPSTGKYTTKGKQWKYEKDKMPIDLHYEDKLYKHFFEGVWNRDMATLISNELWLRDIPNVSPHHKWKDIKLYDQVNTINDWHKNNPIALLLELHSNAANTRARGFEIFTSPGETKSDKYAEMLYNIIDKDFDMKMRRDTSDGDYDKEARFTMITKTWCPAILPEFGFYDNIDDVQYIMRHDVMKRYAKACSDVAEQAYKDAMK